MATDHAPDAQTTALLRTLLAALEDKKAENLKVLNVGGISDITDYLVLATGNSEPHLRALRIEAERVFDATKTKIAGMDSGGFNSGWTVVDAYQIMVHFFTAEQRENYSLEKLWKDAPEVDVKKLMAKPKAAKASQSKTTKAKPAAARKKTAPKKPAAKKATKSAPKPKTAAKPKATAPKKKVAAKKK
jgi:iojap-like ribosome-associated protein